MGLTLCVRDIIGWIAVVVGSVLAPMLFCFVAAPWLCTGRVWAAHLAYNGHVMAVPAGAHWGYLGFRALKPVDR